MSYSQTQWILIFYIYCFAGWLWECCYVSIRKRQWINRGFLYGPWLPIYGTGAITILFTTLPASNSNILIFLIGMFSATILEYVTGAVMERLFHMRYWDYSDQPLNLNGHICLGVSLGWGLFSLILIRMIHPPVEKFVFMISGSIADAFCIILTILFSVDVTKSVQNALDLKELMVKLTESKEAMEQLEKRYLSLVEKLDYCSDWMKERIREIETTLVEKKEVSYKQIKEKELLGREMLMEKLAEQRYRKAKRLSVSREKINIVLSEVAQQLERAMTAQEKQTLEKVRSSLLELQSSIHKIEVEMAARKNREFQKAISILERNPSAMSKKYQKAFSELKKLKKDKKHKTGQ